MKKKMTTPTLKGRGADRSIGFDTLARMTAEQFAHVDERFDGVDKRLDAMDTKFEARFDKLEAGQQRIIDVLLEIPSKKAFERLDNKVQTFDARLTSVERKVK